MLLLLKGQSVCIVKPTGTGVRQREDKGQGSKKGQKKRKVEREFEEVEKLPEYHTGDLVCSTCHKKCKSSNALKLHIEMFNKGDFCTLVMNVGKASTPKKVLLPTKWLISLMERDGLAQRVVMLPFALRRLRLIMLTKA